MHQPGRLPADLERDKTSKPAKIIPLLALQTGGRVVDLFGSGGYYSELLAQVVGTSGEVLLHNNRGFKAWGINRHNDRFAGNRGAKLPAITHHDREIEDLDFGPNTLDGAILVMALHDLYVVPTRYNGEKYVPVGPPADVDHFMQQVYEGLKPGARFVIVDHAASDHTPRDEAFELHRMHESFAKAEMERLGFRFVVSSDVLKNLGDDRTAIDDRNAIVFDSDIKGRTDRFVLVFEKP
jgi:predicted methyltransferase